jgi:hypothetical protein
VVLFSAEGRDDLAPRTVDREDCSPLVDDACIPADIYIIRSITRSMRTSSTTFSVALYSSDIHAQVWKSRV